MAGARIKSIEGLRALAIASVVAYHLEVGWLPSGHMGVVMFLVLTGYLVTNSILREYDRTGGVDLLGFWGRRLKRIWPPMAAMILLVCVTCIACNHVALTKMRPDILPSLLFFDNWNYIVNGLSYFDKIGGVSPLTHLWYLGVDAQLCIVWPALLAAGLKLTHNNKTAMVGVAAALALVSAVLMGLLYVPGADPSRVYYGCDTRAFAVLLGAVLAFMWPLGYMPAVGRRLFVEQTGVRRCADPSSARGYVDRPVYGPSVFAQASGWIGLAGLVVIMVAVPATSAFFYYGGMLLAALLTCMVLVSLLSPGTLLNRAFSCTPLQWLGSRSFALYLWHYPAIVLMGADGGAAWWLKLLAVAVSLALAELAWRFVEKPLGSKELMGRIRNEGLAFFARMPQVAGAGTCCVLLLVAVVGCIVVPETTLVPKDAISSTGEAVDKARDLTAGRGSTAGAGQAGGGTVARGGGNEQGGQASGDDGTSANSQGNAGEGGEAAGGDTANGTPVVQETQVGPDGQPGGSDAGDNAAAQGGPAPVELPEGVMSFSLRQSDADSAAGLYSPMLIGDSVPPEDGFYDVFPTGYEDAYVGRMPTQAFGVFADYASQGVVGKVVVFACFSNTTPTPDQLEGMVASLPQGTHAFLVGTVNPDGFQDAANANLMACADAHDNVHYIDWPSVCAGHEDIYLWADNTHLRPEGEQAYLDMIARAVAQTMVDAGGTVTAR